MATQSITAPRSIARSLDAPVAQERRGEGRPTTAKWAEPESFRDFPGKTLSSGGAPA